MINVKIFDRKVKVRSFKEMLTSEYFQLEGSFDVLDYIALQTGNKVEDLMAVSINRRVISKIANIDINSFQCHSIKHKGTRYTGFNAFPYGVSYLAGKFAREERENLSLWIFSTALNYKITENFNIFEINKVYEDLLNRPALDVIPVLKFFNSHFDKKKVFTRTNLKIFMKTFPIIIKALAQSLSNSITRKIKRKKY